MEAKDWEGARAELEVADHYWPDSMEVHQSLSEVWMRKGLESFQADRLEEAEQGLQTALDWDPESIMAGYLLGSVHMELGDYGAAAKDWHRVVDGARLNGLTLPEPVHLSLARVLALDDKADEARQVLNDYLEFEPRGTYEAETRSLLESLGAH